MKKYTLLVLMLLPIIKLWGQGDKTLAEGKVSYITMQNIYVKFETEGMVKQGDTIFIQKNQVMIPLFISESVSSTSSVGKPLGKLDVKVSDIVYLKLHGNINSEIGKIKETISVNQVQQINPVQSQISILPEKTAIAPERQEKIRGRISASSYSNFSNNSAFSQRLRYSLSLTADNISDGRISTDSYIMFTHRLNYWAEVQENIWSALKIYSLAVKYNATDHTSLTLGRKINPKIASIGAIDGLQTEIKTGKFTIGAVAGFNPDYSDYSFNSKLPEYGAYLSFDAKNKNGFLTNSIGAFEQTNHGKTDRRFAYLQHDNSLIKNINLFASCEVDLYATKNGIAANTVSLTSVYLSLRYRMSKQLSAYISYDARKNVIYYETFKNYLDQLLLDATRQGYQLRINYRPTNNISAGITGGYRFQKKDPKPMQNVNGYLTFSKVPVINSSMTFSTNWLQTSYVTGTIYGVQIYRDLIPAKLSTAISYRLVDNQYQNNPTKSLQHMGALEFSWQIQKKLSFSVNYDGTFEKTVKYHSVYVNLIQRF